MLLRRMDILQNDLGIVLAMRRLEVEAWHLVMLEMLVVGRCKAGSQ